MTTMTENDVKTPGVKPKKRFKERTCFVLIQAVTPPRAGSEAEERTELMMELLKKGKWVPEELSPKSRDLLNALRKQAGLSTIRARQAKF